MTKSKNNEIKNVLLRTIIKLYEGSYPTQNVKLAHKAKKVLGSRFLSIEKDDDSIIEPLVRRNLDDFYKSANGVEIIDFSKSSTFFPSRTGSFYRDEEVMEIAIRSPYLTLVDFFDYIKTRPDAERFGSMAYYQSRFSPDEFLGLCKIEEIKNSLCEEINLIIEECSKKGYGYLYTKDLIDELITPYFPENKNYDPELYEGIKGGPVYKNMKGFLFFYYQTRGKITDKVPQYASGKKFREYCKKFRIETYADIWRDGPGNKKLSQKELDEKFNFYRKFGIPTKIYLQEIYGNVVIDELFPNKRKALDITLDEAKLIQEEINKGETIKDAAKRIGISQASLVNILKKKYKLSYITRTSKKEVDLERVKFLIGERKTYSEIASIIRNETGNIITPIVIARVIKENNIPVFHKYTEKNIDPKIIEDLLLNKGETIDSISKIFFTSSKKISEIIKTHKIPYFSKFSGQVNKDQEEKILSLFNQGKNINETRKELKIGYRTVEKVSVKHSISFNVKPGPKKKTI